MFLLIAVAQAAELSNEQTSRYQNLINELRCLVCQNQNIADSNAPLANDLREQVQAQILAGRSDSEITRYLTDRYGDFVLYRPPFKASTALLWLAPLLLLAGALLAGLAFLRRSRRVKPPVAAPDQAALAKLLAEEHKPS